MDTLSAPTADLIRELVRKLLKSGNTAHARALIEAVRIACDEMTAEANEAARQPNALR
jgi:hypothetical protein